MKHAETMMVEQRQLISWAQTFDGRAADAPKIHTMCDVIRHAHFSDRPLFVGHWGLARVTVAILRRVTSSADAAAVAETRPLVAMAVLSCGIRGADKLACAVEKWSTLEVAECAAEFSASVVKWRAVHETDVADMQVVVLPLMAVLHRLVGSVGGNNAVVWEHFESVSRSVAVCIHTLGVGAAEREALGKEAVGQWVAVVVRFSAERNGAHLDEALSFLLRGWCLPRWKEVEQPHTKCGVVKSVEDAAIVHGCVRLALQYGFVGQHWPYLRSLLLRRGRGMMKEIEVALVGEWATAVKPRLRYLWRDVPPLIDVNSLKPWMGPLDVLDQDLHMLLASSTAPADEESGIKHGLLLHLAAMEMESVVGDAAVNVRLPGLTVAEWQQYVHPVVSVALRHGEVEAAMDLLQWGASCAETSNLRWLRRLEAHAAAQDVGCSPLRQSSPPPPSSSSVPPLLATFMAEVLAPRVSADAAFDVLATSSHVGTLRLVCDGALRLSCSWGKIILQHAFGPPLLVSGLAKLIHELINVGDLPLAKLYISTMAVCLDSVPSRGGLFLLLQAAGRLSVEMCGDLDQPNAAIPTSDMSAWKCYASALGSLMPHHRIFRVGTTTLRTYKLGDAFAARRRMLKDFVRGDDDADEPPSAANIIPFTAIHVEMSGEHILLHRSRHGEVVEDQTTVRIEGGELLRSLLVRMQHIQQQNRAQLSVGSEACEDGDAHPMSDEERSNAKHRWWSRRVDLEVELRNVVGELEGHLGMGRLLFLGELHPDLQRRVRSLGDDFAVHVARLVEPSTDVMASLRRLSGVLLCGLPWACCCGGRDDSLTDGSLVERMTALGSAYVGMAFMFGHHHSGSGEEKCCGECQRLIASTGSVLADAVAQHLCSSDGREMENTCEEHAEELLELCTKYSELVLNAMYDHQCRGASDERHVDLLRLPRTHIYLILDNELHSFPWESMEILRIFSASRVPSTAYLLDSLRGCSPSSCSATLRRVHFSIDVTAASKSGRFASLIAAHDSWTCDCAAAPQRRDGDSALLHTLAHQDADAYVYVGHRCGEHLLSRSQLYERFPLGNGMLAMLMGCGSARLIGSAACEAFGMPLAYLHAGFRAFVGCLWDITDGEVDRLTRLVLERLAVADGAHTGGKQLSLGEILAYARSRCKLPMLSGAATVLYGLHELH